MSETVRGAFVALRNVYPLLLTLIGGKRKYMILLKNSRFLANTPYPLLFVAYCVPFTYYPPRSGWALRSGLVALRYTLSILIILLILKESKGYRG